MTAKQVAQAVLKQLPDDCSIEDIQYQLYVVETLRRRTELADKDHDFVTQDEAEKRMAKWLTK